VSITNYKSHEPLYILIISHPNANHQLTKWAKEFKVHGKIESNKMKLFDTRGLSLFHLHWPHNLEDTLIWDCWNKCHLDLS
jgi:hypothetical protein